MAFTVYSNAATVDGSALFAYGIATSSTAGAGPAAGVYVYAIGDGQQKLRFFYSSTANSIALPTLVAPNVVPTNFNPCATTASAAGPIYQLVQSGSDYGAATTAGGPYLVTLSFSAGSPDSASPFQFMLDLSAVILVASTAYNGA
jgi:hypothetical protein